MKTFAQHDVAIIIPALNPPESLVGLARELHRRTGAPIVVVNDGSASQCDPIFQQLVADGNTVLRCDHTGGKGHAIKCGIETYFHFFPESLGVVTADCDGQHSEEEIVQCVEQLRINSDRVIVGVRTLPGERPMPWTSRLGNRICRKLLRWRFGIDIADTQSGLRGLPRVFARGVLALPEAHFDFEMAMLIAAQRMDFDLLPLPITVRYAENHTSYFRKFADSWRVLRAIFRSRL